MIALLIYWFVLFVVCYIVVEVGQKQLYDEVTPHAPLKLLGGTLVLAGLLSWTKSTYDTMFTAEIHLTALQAIAWFVVFLFVFRFHPLHAAVLGIATMLILAGAASIVVESLTKPRSTAAETEFAPAPKAVRRPSGGGTGRTPAPEQAK